MPETHSQQLITELAIDQLSAYNAHDLDAFCACYHDDVRVLSFDGTVLIDGLPAFREQYRPMFARGGFGAEVSERLALGGHCVERESWWRVKDAERSEGVVLVRYSLLDAQIGTVVFLEPDAALASTAQQSSQQQEKT